MGWSCTKAALDKLNYVMSLSMEESSNTWRNNNGEYFFYELPNREHADGRITATIMRFVGDNLCRKVGSLRIEADGTVTRWPHLNTNMRLASEATLPADLPSHIFAP